MTDDLVKIREIEHNRKILNDAEEIWGWGTPAGQKRAERRAEYLIRFADIRSGKKILEVGCGTGVYTEKLAKTGAEIIAIDISTDFLEKARQKIKNFNVSFIEADLEELSFNEKSFDAVVGVSVLHHMDVEKALKQIKRVLKPGGFIVFSEPNMLNPQVAIERSTQWTRKMAINSPDETAFFRWSLKKLLERNNFGDVRIKPFDFLHPMTPNFLINFMSQLGFFIEKTPLLREFSGSLLIYARAEQSVKNHFNKIASNYDFWKRKNNYYYQNLKNILKDYIKPGKIILDFGCGTGEIITYLNPSFGIGFDISETMVEIAKNKFKNHSQIIFTSEDIESLTENKNFDFILLIDVIEHLENPITVLQKIKRISSRNTTVIMTMVNPLWEPALLVAEKLELKMPEGPHTRISVKEVERLLTNEGFVIKEIGYKILMPIKIPVISDLINKYSYKIPLLKRLSFVVYFIAHPL